DRDLVPGEWHARDRGVPSGSEYASQRIEKLRRPGAEVALPFGRRGDLGHAIAAGSAPASVIAHKKETVVTAVVNLRKKNRAACGEAKLILLERCLVVKSGLELLQRIISEEIPQRAVQLVRAGFHRHAHLPDPRSELGGIKRILEFELVHGLD